MYFAKKRAEVFIEIDDLYTVKRLTSEIEEGSYTYIAKLLKQFEDKGYINTDRQGRKKVIFLTEKGKKVKRHLRKLRNDE